MDPAATALPDAASEHEDGYERRGRSGSRASRDGTEVPSVNEEGGVEAGSGGQGEKEVVREKEERGMRRVVYNFTPSYVYTLLSSIPPMPVTLKDVRQANVRRP